MNSFVKKAFDEGPFRLNEEDITKIVDIINDRSSELPGPPTLKAKVFREDSLVFETACMDDLSREENAVRNRVSRIDFVVDDPTLKLALLFDRKEGLKLHIESPHKNVCLLLLTDLGTYLRTEVIDKRWLRKAQLSEVGFLFMVVPMLIAMVMVFANIKGPEPKVVNQVLASSNAVEKMDYLIRESQSRAQMPYSWLALFFGIAVGSPLIGLLIRKYRFSNTFGLGRELEEIAARKKVQEKIFWGVVIAFAVGVISSLVVWWLTLQKPS